MFKIVTKKLIAIVFIAIAIFLLIHFNSGKINNRNLIKSKNGLFRISITTTGELEAKNNLLVLAPGELKNQKMGYIQTKIQDIIPEGTSVKKGDYIATLDQSELINRKNEIENEILKQEAEFLKNKLDTTLSMRDLRKQIEDKKYELEEKKLIVSQSIYEPPATLRQAQLTYEKAVREYEQIKNDYNIKAEQKAVGFTEIIIRINQLKKHKEEIENLIKNFTIYTSHSGMVIYKRDRRGYIQGIGSEINPHDLTIATIPDMSTMVSKTYINELDIHKVKVGQRVEVRLDAFPDKIKEGKVISVSNIGMQLPNSDAKVFETIIEIDNKDGFMKPSMTTSNTIICEEYKNVVFVPMDAVQTNDTVSFVFTKKYRQIVELGSANDNFVIIKKGLEENQEILLDIPENIDNYPFIKL